MSSYEAVFGWCIGTCLSCYCRISSFQLAEVGSVVVTSSCECWVQSLYRVAWIEVAVVNWSFCYLTVPVATIILQTWHCFVCERLLQFLKLCFPLYELGRESFVVLGSTPLNAFVEHCTGTNDSTVNVRNSTKPRVRFPYTKLQW